MVCVIGILKLIDEVELKWMRDIFFDLLVSFFFVKVICFEKFVDFFGLICDEL